MALVVSQSITKKTEKHWISYIKQRISQNKNFIGIVVGKTGSGKSLTSLSIGEQLDDEFDESRVVFSGLELMNLINSGELKKGSVIVFEEAGVEMNNRNWQSVTNKMLNFLLQTFRHKNFILIMNTPHIDFVDASTRKLFHAEFRTIGIDFKTNECKLKPNLIDYNSRSQKFFYPRLRVITKEGKIPISIWKVGKPSKELLDKYESKKKAFTDELNKKIMNELMQIENSNQVKHKPLTDKQQFIYESLKGKKTIKDIAESNNVSQQIIYSQIELIKKKGYSIKPVKEGSKVIYYEVED